VLGSSSSSSGVNLMPVIPLAIIGTDIIAPPGKIITKIVSPTVEFGEPLDFWRYEGMSEDRFILRSITDEIMYPILELSGQEYVDIGHVVPRR
jgi:1-acyl-sn-glycerol-3-phosphate acyltransferase